MNDFTSTEYIDHIGLISKSYVACMGDSCWLVFGLQHTSNTEMMKKSVSISFRSPCANGACVFKAGQTPQQQLSIGNNNIEQIRWKEGGQWRRASRRLLMNRNRSMCRRHRFNIFVGITAIQLTDTFGGKEKVTIFGLVRVAARQWNINEKKRPLFWKCHDAKDLLRLFFTDFSMICACDVNYQRLRW